MEETLTEIEKRWLESFDKNEQPAALAYLHYKRAIGHSNLDRKSRTQLWMDGFEVGIGCGRTLDAVSGTTEKAPDPPSIA